jgi:hypothetical protein
MLSMVDSLRVAVIMAREKPARQKMDGIFGSGCRKCHLIRINSMRRKSPRIDAKGEPT